LTPLAYFPIDGALIVVGSRGGAPSDPAWVHNLRADPRAEVEAGVESFDAIGRETPRDERDRLFDQIAALAPQFAVYRSKTTRMIPVFDLQRQPTTSA
jgi:deazaflavin-dependent oxidoreductase (nitroreductase family)